MKPKIIPIRVTQEMVENRVLDRLRVIAEKRKRPLSFLIREALVEYLERQEGKEISVD